MGRKILLGCLGAIFLLFAYFQWNDPDSFKWIIYYLIIGVLAFTSLLQVNKPVYIYAMLILSAIWMISLLPNAITWVKDGMPTIVESMKASSPYIELVREFLGLLISILMLLFLLYDARRTARASKTN